MREYLATKTEQDPPFDGEPCCCCPWQVRGLYAAAHKAFGAWRHADSPARVAHKMAELGEAVRAMAPLIEAHFADVGHAYGPSLRVHEVRGDDV